MAKKIPSALIEITPGGIKVDFSNWEGVSAAQIENCYHALIKANHEFRARGLHEWRKRDEENRKLDEELTQLLKENEDVPA